MGHWTFPEVKISDPVHLSPVKTRLEEPTQAGTASSSSNAAGGKNYAMICSATECFHHPLTSSLQSSLFNQFAHGRYLSIVGKLSGLDFFSQDFADGVRLRLGRCYRGIAHLSLTVVRLSI